MRAAALLIFAVLPAASSASLVAQETVNQASVGGRVVDTQGLPVPGAIVAIRQLDTNITTQNVSADDGRFRFPYLKPGSYELTVSLQGFSSVRRSLTLAVGSAFELPVTLAVAGVDATVDVVGQPPVIETARSLVMVYQL